MGKKQPQANTPSITVKFTPEQVHELFERFDANHNGLYARRLPIDL